MKDLSLLDMSLISLLPADIQLSTSTANFSLLRLMACIIVGWLAGPFVNPVLGPDGPQQFMKCVQISLNSWDVAVI